MREAPFILFRNPSHGWSAIPPGFRNLPHDPIGHGLTRVDAIVQLLGHPEFIRRAQLGEWPLQPRLSAFVESPNRYGLILNGHAETQSSHG